MQECNTIGGRIQSIRKKKGMTQADLAKKMGVKRETVNQWESGTRDLKTSATVGLADIFGVTCDEILRGVTAENAEIHRTTGLSDDAIGILRRMKDESDPRTAVVDFLLRQDGYDALLYEILRYGDAERSADKARNTTKDVHKFREWASTLDDDLYIPATYPYYAELDGEKVKESSLLALTRLIQDLAMLWEGFVNA